MKRAISLVLITTLVFGCSISNDKSSIQPIRIDKEFKITQETAAGIEQITNGGFQSRIKSEEFLTFDIPNFFKPGGSANLYISKNNHTFFLEDVDGNTIYEYFNIAKFKYIGNLENRKSSLILQDQLGRVYFLDYIGDGQFQNRIIQDAKPDLNYTFVKAGVYDPNTEYMVWQHKNGFASLVLIKRDQLTKHVQVTLPELAGYQVRDVHFQTTSKASFTLFNTITKEFLDLKFNY